MSAEDNRHETKEQMCRMSSEKQHSVSPGENSRFCMRCCHPITCTDQVTDPSSPPLQQVSSFPTAEVQHRHPPRPRFPHLLQDLTCQSHKQPINLKLLFQVSSGVFTGPPAAVGSADEQSYRLTVMSWSLSVLWTDVLIDSIN